MRVFWYVIHRMHLVMMCHSLPMMIVFLGDSRPGRRVGKSLSIGWLHAHAEPNTCLQGHFDLVKSCKQPIECLIGNKQAFGRCCCSSVCKYTGVCVCKYTCLHRCVVWHFAACNRCLSTAKLCSDLLLPYWHWHLSVSPSSFGDLTAWISHVLRDVYRLCSLPLFSSIN